jgi:peroxiredoxin
MLHVKGRQVVKMKKISVFCLVAVLTGSLLLGAVYYGSIIEKVSLAVPVDAGDRSYLGIKQDTGQISLADIDADIVIIEIFNMYCPHCQRHAPTANKLYQIIETDKRTQGRVKLIGIGVGNSPYEVKLFKKKYTVPFPLFDDPNSAVLNKLTGIKTPSFFGIMKKGKVAEAFFMEQGPHDDADAFLRKVIQQSGLSL